MFDEELHNSCLSVVGVSVEMGRQVARMVRNKKTVKAFVGKREAKQTA